MKKKLTAALTLALCLVMMTACALGEINVTKKDMNLNRSLDKNVNNILMIMQDGEKTDTLLIASVNGRTGRSVMTQIPVSVMVNVPEVGDMPISDVYALGGKKSKGLLVARAVNSLLDLNVSTYVAMDITRFPELVDEIGMLSTWLNEEEAKILGTWPGDNVLTSKNVLDYIAIRLEEDYVEKNRCYMVFMDLLKQGLRSSAGLNLVGLGKKLLDSMDSNLNPLAAGTMLSSFQAGDDRRELFLYTDMTAEEMRAAFHKEVYE